VLSLTHTNLESYMTGLSRFILALSRIISATGYHVPGSPDPGFHFVTDSTGLSYTQRVRYDRMVLHILPEGHLYARNGAFRLPSPPKTK
jgi:hypothetical protein